jgi:membrane protease YdiL (CAAX protease family)
VVSTAGQVRAILLLLGRHLKRRAPKAGAAPKQSGVPTFLVLGAVWSLYMGNLVWNMAERAAQVKEGSANAIGWQLYGVIAMMMGFGLGELAPEIGRVRSPLRATLLDELPVTTAARLALAWLRNPLAIALPIVTGLAWAGPARHQPVAVVRVVALSLLLYLATITTGYALATWVRILGSATVRRTIGIGSFVLTIAGFPLLTSGAALNGVSPTRMMAGLARVFTGGGHLALAAALLGAWLGAAIGLVALGEWRGYDRLDAASAKKHKRTTGKLTLDAVERLVLRREGGLVVIGVQVLLLILVLGGGALALFTQPKPDTMKQLALGYATFVAYVGAIVSLSQSGVAARRDAGVRALLAPLPLSPFDTLAGKVRAIRRILTPLLLTGAAALAVAIRWSHVMPFDVTWMILWRTAAALVGVWLATDASVSVAFLSNGLGLPGTRSLGAPTNYATLLLMLPLLAGASAPNAFVAACSIATLGAIGAEARRAARLCVRWLDDAADDVERETTVWRALLALAVFFAVQALGAQFLKLGDNPTGGGLAITYGIAGAVLVVMTVQGRRNLPPLRLFPSGMKLLSLPMGLVGGALSAVCALGFAELMHAFGPPAGGEIQSSGFDAVWLALALVAMAPIAEELFFRGWLQSAIAADLPPQRRRWAFLFAALAFAFAHVGSYIVPQLIMGVIAGALYAWTGALLPGLLAHAMHNGLVLWLS